MNYSLPSRIIGAVTRFVSFRILSLRLPAKPKMAPPLIETSEIRDILIVRPDGIGNVVMMSPFLRMKLQERLGKYLIDVTGRTTLRQFAALLKRFRLYVGNDSGPKHLAAASGVPVVELSWKRPQRHPGSSGTCTSRESHCIRGITVDMAKEAVFEQLRKGAYAPASAQ